MNPTKFILKNGKTITVREANVSDAANLINLKLSYIEGSRTIPLLPKEYSDKVEDEENLIEKLHEEKNSILLVAEYEDGLIGNIDLNGNHRSKLFHTGVIGMGIRKEWQGQGVGTVLLESVISWCSQNPHLSLIWLEVYDSNEAGKRLYQKLGFEECGRMKHFFKEDGIYIDKITMVRHL